MTHRAGADSEGPTLIAGLVSGRDGLAYRATLIEWQGPKALVTLSRRGRALLDDAGAPRRVLLYNGPSVITQGTLPESKGETRDICISRVTVAAYRLL